MCYLNILYLWLDKMLSFRLIKGEGVNNTKFPNYSFFFLSCLWYYYMCDFCQDCGAEAS